MKKVYYFFAVFCLVIFSLESAQYPQSPVVASLGLAAEVPPDLASTIPPVSVAQRSPALIPVILPIIEPFDNLFFDDVFRQALDIMPDNFGGSGALYFNGSVYIFGNIGFGQAKEPLIFKFNAAHLNEQPVLNSSFGTNGILNLSQTIILQNGQIINQAFDCTRLVFNENLNCLMATIVTANGQFNVPLDPITGGVL